MKWCLLLLTVVTAQLSDDQTEKPADLSECTMEFVQIAEFDNGGPGIINQTVTRRISFKNTKTTENRTNTDEKTKFSYLTYEQTRAGQNGKGDDETTKKGNSRKLSDVYRMVQDSIFNEREESVKLNILPHSHVIVKQLQLTCGSKTMSLPSVEIISASPYATWIQSVLILFLFYELLMM